MNKYEVNFTDCKHYPSFLLDTKTFLYRYHCYGTFLKMPLFPLITFNLFYTHNSSIASLAIVYTGLFGREYEAT